MKPLSQKLRTASFILMIIVFFIVGPILLINALGLEYEFDKDVFTFVKTGGIYINSDISGTNVYVDGEFVKKNGLFLRNTLIEELKPENTYEVVVMKEGLHTWIKELPVRESLVTEARIFMLPTEINDREIYPYIDLHGIGVVVEPEEEEFLVDEEYIELIELFTPETVEEDEDIFDIDTLEDAVITVKKNIPEYFIELGVEDPDTLENLVSVGGEVSWLEDGNVLLHWIGRKTAAPHYYCLTFEDCRTQITLDWEDDINSFDFFPGRNDILIVSVDSGIFAVEVDDRSERNVYPIYIGEDLEWIKTKDDKVVVKDGDIFHELQF